MSKLAGITPIDIIFMAVVMVFCIKAAFKGFLDEIFGVGTFILCTFGAVKISPYLKPYLSDMMNATLATILAFVIIFVAFFLIMKIIQLALKNVFSGEIFKSLDHGLGFIFGVIEGILIICVLLMIMEALQPWINTQDIRDNSLFNKLLDMVTGFGNSQDGGHF